tara:strand:- start:120 stop:446 length:327 start_codon:yes stop_codon:yes gene_type:complete
MQKTKKVYFGNYGTDVDNIHNLQLIGLQINKVESVCKLNAIGKGHFPLPTLIILETDSSIKYYRKIIKVGIEVFNDNPRKVSSVYERYAPNKPVSRVEITEIAKVTFV